jgi:hypothetical protein
MNPYQLASACQNASPTSFGIPGNLFIAILTLFSFTAFSQVTTISNVTVTPNETCAGNALAVQFDAAATGSNAYSVTLSDETGAFPGIETVVENLDGDQSAVTVNLTVPADALTSSVYVIEVSASGSAPAVSGTFTINAIPNAIIDYGGTPFCTSITSSQAVTLTGTAGGTFSSTAGLSINPTTGGIRPDQSTAGTYTVTYTIPASGGCAGVTATTSVTVTELPIATISYAGTPFCTSITSPRTVTLSGTGGTFSSTAGLSINSFNGEIRPDLSTAGTYTVTYTIPASAGCAPVIATTSVTITALPTATISYGGTPFCKTLTSSQAVTLSGTPGGIFSSTAGLSIDGPTGAIRPDLSTAGTYTVTYTIPASAGCAQVTTTTPVTITQPPTATISYAGTPFCKTNTSPRPVTFTGTTGGTFSSTAGLSINPTTGAISPDLSTAGTYTVTYTIPASAGCLQVIANTSVTITQLPVAQFSYAGSPYCASSANPSPTFLNGGVAGTFTSTAGLSINPVSGVVNIAASTPGTYSVTNTIPAAGGCAAVPHTASITIHSVPLASVTASSTTTNINSGAVVTVNSTTLAQGAYIVTYSVSGTNTVSSTTAIMNFETVANSNTGTFTTALLTNVGNANVVNITSIAFQSTSCASTVSASTPAFTTVFGYTSVKTGNWNDPTTWSPQPPAGTYPTSATDIITIAANQTVTIPAGLSVTVDQITVQGTLTVAASGQLTIANGAGTDLTLSGANARLNVSGVWEMSDGATSTGHTPITTSVQAGGTYRHAYTTAQGVIPIANWVATSTLEIVGYTTFGAATAAGNWSQNFANVTWNCPSQTATFICSGLLRNITGSLSVVNTGTGRLDLATNQTITINVGADLNVSGNALVYFSNYEGTGNSSENLTLTVGRDFNYTSTALGAEGVGGLLNDSRKTALTIGRNFNMNAPGGKITLSTKTNSQNSDDGTTFNLGGNFSLIAGSFLATESNSGRMGDIIFLGAPGTQHDFTNTGTIDGAINYYVKRGNILRMVGESALMSSQGNFELGEDGPNFGATLILESNAPGGAIQRGVKAGPGNIRVGNSAGRRRFQSNSVIIYRGTGKQYMGDGQPGTFGTVTDQLTTIIDNPAGVDVVTSAQDNTITVAGALDIQSGDVTFAPTLTSAFAVTGAIKLINGTVRVTSTPTIIPTLFIGGDLQGTRFFQFTGTNSIVNVNGTAPMTFTREFPIDVPLTLREFVMNRAGATLVMPQFLTAGAAGIGGVTLTNGNLRMNARLVVVNSINLVNGILYFENQQVELQGAVTTTASTGLLSSNSNSMLRFTTAHASTGNILRFSPTGNVIGSVVLNRSSAVTPHVTLGTPLTVAGSVDLNDGEFLNQSTLTMNNGSGILRSANAAFAPTSNVPSGGPYNLLYRDGVAPSTIDLTTYVEAQGNLLDVTTNCTGTVLLNSNMNATGDFYVNSGTFTSQGYSVSVNDCLNEGILNSSSSTFTMSGSFTNNNTFNHNAGTVVFAGSSSILGTTNPLFHAVTINPVSTLISPVSLDLESHFTNNGTFAAGESTQIWFRGSAMQNISGSSVTNFYNILVTNSVGVSVQSNQRLIGTLSVGPNGKFDADGSNNSVFTLVSTADDPAVDAQIGPLLDNADVSGNVTVQRFMGSFPRIYRYLSSPVSNATIGSWIDNFAITGNFVGSNANKILCGYYLSRSPSLFYFQPGVGPEVYEGYVPYPTTGGLSSPIIAGRGYAAFVRDCTPRVIDVRGPINKGTFDFTVTNTPAPVLNGVEVYPEGFNLIGNPYPSAIDWANPNGWLMNDDVSSIAFIRNNKSNGYIVLDGESASPQLISTAQGFWIQVAGDGPTLSIKEEAKSVDDGSFKRAGKTSDQLIITLSDGVDEDKAITRLRDGTSFGRDRYDGGKLRNDFFDIFTYSSDNVAMSVNTVPDIQCNSSLNIGIRNLKAGEYTISLDVTGAYSAYDVSITDNYNQRRTLLENAVYRFEVTSDSASFAKDRFRLTLLPKASSAPVEVADVPVSCGGDLMVEIANTRSDAMYQVVFGDSVLAKLSGTGYDITYSLPAAVLGKGQHQLHIQSLASCGAVADSKVITVGISGAPQGLTGINGKSCGDGIITLGVSGVSANDIVKWYDDPDESTMLFMGPSFSTPNAEKSQTYYAEVVNVDGCRSERIPVTAQVILIEPPVILQKENHTLTTAAGEEVEWFYNELPLGKAKEITPEESGVYSAVVSTGGCSARAEYTLIVTAVEAGSDNIRVYPNPFTNQLRIVVKEQNLRQISLLSLSGKSYDLHSSPHSAVDEKAYDVSEISAGVYFLRIDAGRTVRFIKVIKL